MPGPVLLWVGVCAGACAVCVVVCALAVGLGLERVTRVGSLVAVVLDIGQLESLFV